MADEPEEHDVAAEREELGDGGDGDPAGVGLECAAERVGEDAERAAGQEQDGGGRRGEREGERRTPGDHPHVERGEGELLGSGDWRLGRPREQYPVRPVLLYIGDVPSHDPTASRTRLRGTPYRELMDGAHAGSAGVAGSIAVTGSAGVAGSIAVAGSAGVAGSIAVSGSAGVAGSIAVTASAGVAGGIGNVACVGCVGCVGCIACVGCIGCIGVVGRVGEIGTRGPRH